jgi:hypothetical protein
MTVRGVDLYAHTQVVQGLFLLRFFESYIENWKNVSGETKDALSLWSWWSHATFFAPAVALVFVLRMTEIYSRIILVVAPHATTNKKTIH